MARTKQTNHKTSFDVARDELFSHIHRCGVLQASQEQVREWMDDTLAFMADRYPELEEREIKTLEELGMRFCQPVIQHGQTQPQDENAA